MQLLTQRVGGLRLRAEGHEAEALAAASGAVEDDLVGTGTREAKGGRTWSESRAAHSSRMLHPRGHALRSGHAGGVGHFHLWCSPSTQSPCHSCGDNKGSGRGVACRRQITACAVRAPRTHTSCGRGWYAGRLCRQCAKRTWRTRPPGRRRRTSRAGCPRRGGWRAQRRPSTRENEGRSSGQQPREGAQNQAKWSKCHRTKARVSASATSRARSSKQVSAVAS
jgi:hypothetical protein